MERHEVTVLRELGREVAEAAAADVNRETVDLWKRLNRLQPARPMIMLDQLPWNELNTSGELTLRCGDPFLRTLERQLRERLFQFRHFRGDLIMHNHVIVEKAVTVDFGIEADVSTIGAEDAVKAQHYEDLIPDEPALERIPMPVVSVDEALDRQHAASAREIFDGILPVRMMGLPERYGMYCGAWDRITVLRGADRVLYDLADRPDFSLRIITKFAAIWHSLLDQYERLGVLDAEAPYVHCTGACTDELPSRDYDGHKALARDVWTFGLAQVFSSVSPEMHDEFEIQPMKPLLERFGLVYYGCCDPLDRKIDIVRKIRNVRKISVSPWADPERAAEGIGRDFVFSAKPNPAHLAMDTFDEDLVRRELRHIVDTCRRHGCPCELILKDVSTVRGDPNRLTRWERIAREVSAPSG